MFWCLCLSNLRSGCVGIGNGGDCVGEISLKDELGKNEFKAVGDDGDDGPMSSGSLVGIDRFGCTCECKVCVVAICFWTKRILSRSS